MQAGLLHAYRKQLTQATEYDQNNQQLACEEKYTSSQQSCHSQRVEPNVRLRSSLMTREVQLSNQEAEAPATRTTHLEYGRDKTHASSQGNSLHGKDDLGKLISWCLAVRTDQHMVLLCLNMVADGVYWRATGHDCKVSRLPVSSIHWAP